MHTCVSRPSSLASPSPKSAHAQGIFINLPIAYAYYVHSYMYIVNCLLPLSFQVTHFNYTSVPPSLTLLYHCYTHWNQEWVFEYSHPKRSDFLSVEL